MVVFTIFSLVVSIIAYAMSFKLKDKMWTNLAIGAILLNLLSITIILMNQ